jgi:predicted phosphodiesterase
MATDLKRIGFLADTHSAKNDGSDLPDSVLKAFKGVDLIVHLGDIGKKAILPRLAEVAPVMIQSEDRKGYTFAGPPAGGGKILPGAPVKTIGRGAHAVGLIFNLAQPDKKIVVGETGIEFPDDFDKCMDRRFKQPVNVVAFAATHAPMNLTHNGILFFNPGSPTLPMSAPGTVAILDLSKKAPAAKVVNV